MLRKHVLIPVAGFLLAVAGADSVRAEEEAVIHAKPAAAAFTTFTVSADTMLVGEERLHSVQEGETLFQIARHYNLGVGELMVSNPGVDPWMPETGLELTIPGRFVLPTAPREGVVVNLAQRRLFYFLPDGNQVLSWPVSIGKQGQDTPLGQTRIVRKREHPTWVPPRSVREEFEDLPDSMPPGPNNPLGTRALDLGWPAYVIHGTNLTMGVGAGLSHGCVRMYNRDVEQLYEQASVGTLVTVVNQPVRFARHQGQLYMQVSPDWDRLDARGRVADKATSDRPLGMDTLVELGGNATADLDWQAISATLLDPAGGTVLLGEPGNPEGE